MQDSLSRDYSVPVQCSFYYFLIENFKDDQIGFENIKNINFKFLREPEIFLIVFLFLHSLCSRKKSCFLNSKCLKLEESGDHSFHLSLYFSLIFYVCSRLVSPPCTQPIKAGTLATWSLFSLDFSLVTVGKKGRR